MSNTRKPDDGDKKPTYETPEVIPLGEMARGVGQCYSGSTETMDGCSFGGLNMGEMCTSGTAEFFPPN